MKEQARIFVSALKFALPKIALQLNILKGAEHLFLLEVQASTFS